MVRLVAPAIAQAVGQTAVVESRAGAGGTVGADMAAKAASGGYTLMVSHAAPHGIAAGIYPSLPYDPVAACTHLAMLCDTGNVLLVNKASPFRTLGEFRDAARARGVRYGSSGIGSITHLMGEVLAREANAPRLDCVP